MFWTLLTFILLTEINPKKHQDIFSKSLLLCSKEKKSHVWNDMKVRKWHYCHFWMNYAVIYFFLVALRLLMEVVRSRDATQALKQKGDTLWWSLGWGCVMVVLVPLCPLSVSLRAQLLGHAASICLQRWGATHHQHSQSITPRVKSKLSSTTHALRAWELMPCQSKPMHL